MRETAELCAEANICWPDNDSEPDKKITKSFCQDIIAIQKLSL